MRVSNSYNPYARIPNKATVKNSGFADILANQARVSGDSFSRSPQMKSQRTEPDNKDTISSDSAIREAVATTKPVAENYPATLTQEQIADLNSRYDVKNMKWATYESVAFGEELFALGAINDDQRLLFYGVAKLNLDPNQPGILTPEGETQTRQFNYDPKPGDSMIDILMGELAVQQKNLDFYRSPDSPEKRRHSAHDGPDYSDHIKHLENYIAPYQSTYDIMKLFI